MQIKKIVTSVLFLSFILAPFTSTEAATTNKGADDTPWLLTYYVGYQNHYLKPRNVDFSLMTHIVVGGVGVKADGSLNEHWHLEGTDNKKEGRKMALDIGKRADKEDVKKLVWLGGPNEEDLFFSATSDKNRKKFVKNILELLEELEYDGIDIDWEPVRVKDEPYLLILVQDLRKADPDIIITVPVNWVPSSIAKTKNLSVYKKVSESVDKMFVMSYSMAGPWPGWNSWHGSALEGEGTLSPSSIDSSISAYLKAGVPKEKIGIGVGTYATCWEYPVKRPDQKLPATFYSSAMHVMSMRTMMDEYYKSKYEKWDTKANVPYLSFKKKQGDFECGFISYEDEKSVEEKVKYVNEKNLGGVLVWNIGTGYFPKNSASKRHPLLKQIWETLQ